MGVPLVPSAEKYFLSYKRFQEISDIFKQYIFRDIRLGGGEPTLIPDFNLISGNMRSLFHALSYNMATNGAKLKDYLDIVKNFDQIDFSYYPGDNDAIFNHVYGDISLPYFYLIGRDDEELYFQDTRTGRPEDFNKAEYCFIRTMPQIDNTRMLPCCYALGVCRWHGLNVNDYAVSLDSDWLENINAAVKGMKTLCDFCCMKVNRTDKPFYLEAVDTHDKTLFEKIRTRNSLSPLPKKLQKNSDIKNLECIARLTRDSFFCSFISKNILSTFPVESPHDPIGDISSPEKISVRKSFYSSSYFDVPFVWDQFFKISFYFESCPPKISVLIRDEYWNPVYRNSIVSSDEKWEWEFVLNRPCERLCIILHSENIYDIVLPSLVTIESDSCSLEFLKMQHAREERQFLGDENNRLQNDCARLQDEHNRLQGERNFFEGENNRLRDDSDGLRASLSYRIGRAITWPPRKVRGFFRYLKRHGVKYTIKHLISFFRK
jgi:hypothetical protein